MNRYIRVCKSCGCMFYPMGDKPSCPECGSRIKPLVFRSRKRGRRPRKAMLNDVAKVS